MIVSDTDFLSSFAKIDELKLVFRVFKTKEIVITETNAKLGFTPQREKPIA